MVIKYINFDKVADKSKWISDLWDDLYKRKKHLDSEIERIVRDFNKSANEEEKDILQEYLLSRGEEFTRELQALDTEIREKGIHHLKTIAIQFCKENNIDLILDEGSTLFISKKFDVTKEFKAFVYKYENKKK